MTRPDKANADRRAPSALAVVGVLLWLVASQEPAMLDGRIGPGFVARVLAAGVVGIAALLLWRALVGRHDAGFEGLRERPGNALAGPMLLAGVLAFALLVPWLGLVPASAVSAGLAAFAAGDRRPLSIGAVTIALALLVALVGWALLPPTAPLWPRP